MLLRFCCLTFGLTVTGVKYKYDFKKISTFDDFVDRAVIDWGSNARAYHQWLTPKEIIEILPHGYIGAFPGYLDFILTFSQLQKMISNKKANILWYQNLSQVSGIYLILDTKTGLQYIGSASGSEGIWGRWSNYANDGHGGNKKLIKLVKKDSNYYHNFKYSILQVLPRNMIKKEIIKYEFMYQEKLCSRAFGLN